MKKHSRRIPGISAVCLCAVFAALAPVSIRASALPPAKLAATLLACAQHVNPQTQAALVSNESGGDPLALHDNNSGRAYFPGSYDDALVIGSALIAHDRAIGGHGIDVGIGQINSHNFAGLHISVSQMLDACENLRVSSTMLLARYHMHGSVDAALQAYNSGSPTGDAGYVARVRAAAAQEYVRAVVAAAGALPRTDTRPPVPTRTTARFTSTPANGNPETATPSNVTARATANRSAHFYNGDSN